MALTGTGGATVVLSGTNTYSGDTTLRAPPLRSGAASAPSQKSDLVVVGGALDMGGLSAVYQNPNDGNVYVLLGGGGAIA